MGQGKDKERGQTMKCFAISLIRFCSSTTRVAVEGQLMLDGARQTQLCPAWGSPGLSSQIPCSPNLGTHPRITLGRSFKVKAIAVCLITPSTHTKGNKMVLFTQG